MTRGCCRTMMDGERKVQERMLWHLLLVHDDGRWM